MNAVTLHELSLVLSTPSLEQNIKSPPCFPTVVQPIKQNKKAYVGFCFVLKITMEVNLRYFLFVLLLLLSQDK